MIAEALSRGSLVDCELGHYRIVEKIGEGGMGEVFRARDQHLGRDVALKVLPPGTFTDDHARRLFRKEADALSKLNHPNIVTVHDFDTQENLAFLVMEHVPGTTLSEKLSRGPLSRTEVIQIGVQLAEGLAAAHEQGVIHGDLKPGNLRLTGDNRLKILDFGLARSVRCLNPATTTESAAGIEPLAGTLSYMPPEQLRGQAIDARSDVYSAGVVLYELATGQVPFSKKLSTVLVDDILHRTPVPPAEVRPGISPALAEVILRCIEKEPEKRYQSAKDLLLDLQQLANPATARFGRVPPHSATRYGLYALTACVVVVLLVTLWRRTPAEWRNRLLSRSEPRIESLAVLPLANLSGDSQQDYLADGMTEALITDLGQIHAFQRVISRTSVIRYKTERTPLREIARQLDVDAVIEGSVLRSDKTVQVTVRLVNSADTQLWSRSYQREFRDLLALQRELALAIAREIGVSVTAGEQARLSWSRPIDTAAQEGYLKAKYLSNGTAEQRAKSRQYLEQSIQSDPNYAPAYAGLADSFWNDIDLPAREAMPRARQYALKAISLDETMAQAHTALATVRFYGDWDWAGADREYQRALQLNPSDAEARRMYSVFLSAMGRGQEAWTQLQAAQVLDPLYIDNSTTAGWVLYCARQYDQAMEQCQRALELAPNYDSSHACLSYCYLGKGQNSEAIAESKKAWSLSGGETIRSVLLGRSYAQAGNKAETRKILHHLLQRSSQTYVPPYFIAVLYAALEDKESALRWLTNAHSERDLYLAWIKVDPAVDSLRADARFQELLTTMGLAAP
ncbi:MAG: protein kinase [Acidobacteriia bacterium]|nr:protein kinase [Terriglobia bacterium]